MSQQEELQNTLSPYDSGEEGISIAELLHIFRKRFRWFVIGLIVVMGLAVGYLQIAVPQYESQVSVLVEPIQRSSSFESLLDVSTSTTKIATEVELITSRKNIEYALSTLDLASYHNADGVDYRSKEALGNVKERIVVSTVKDTNIVRIAVTDASPAFARDFSNALAASYDSLLTGIAKNSKTAQREFIESQIPINDAELSNASDSLGDFRENSDIIQLTDKSSLLVEQISYYTLRLEPLKLQLKESQVFIESYTNSLKAAGIAGVLALDQIKNDSVVMAKLADLGAWKTELTMYESLSNPAGNTATVAPSTVLDSSSRTYVISSAISQVTKELLNRISTLTRSYGNEAYTQAIVQALTTEVGIQVLEMRGEVFVEELSQLPVLERKLSELQRDVQIYEAIGLKLREMLEEVKLTEAAVTGNVTVVDAANLPLNPVSPNKLLILAVAMLLGAAIGLLLTLGVETLDVSIQSEQQIQKIVGKEIPILGWIPMMKVSENDKYPTLSVYNDPLSFESERFKLVANMLYNKTDKKVFSITSCAMAEGKSTIIGNMALALAQMGSKVLVIDGDLRLPSMERYFRLKHREVGLVDFVTKKARLEDCLIQPFENTPTLHLLPPGNAPLVPAAIFSNPRYIQGIAYLENLYDFIIIDAPPLESASELLSISKHVDGLIITVRAGITSKGSLFDLVSNLKTANAPLIGFVFNGVLPGSSSSYRYGYGKGYGYGYGHYAYRYGYAQGQGNARKNSKGHMRRRSTSWYRRRYKLDLKNRGKITTEQFDPVLAFGEHAEFRTLEAWAQAHASTHSSAFFEAKASPSVASQSAPVVQVEEKSATPAVPVAPKQSEKPAKKANVPFDSLSVIEMDELAIGKKQED
ncbi:GumC family protein [Sphaerochaeta globosa]|uniref:non-specific protein-tyrosine kinase n=1 Tax=Sphaerochaeta globosa (strain ATCC BAA-1886 / DSM 22777 / Buddy) TaxID=158189 RepID=F0RTV6_SPHGB|nr:polysaccharide biosynthesis tyrosine autokinase [Sphaerochaeta globosa]ADY13827.1 capsular exopolysaccharide family [Sphaerochaeta globosa str. Buddy]